MLLVDVVIINISMLLAFMIGYDWDPHKINWSLCGFFMLSAVVVRVSFFIFWGMYRWSFRYASLSEALNVARTVSFGSLVLIAIAFFRQTSEVGRSVLLIDYLICLVLVMESRFAPRILIKIWQSRNSGLKRVLIVGAGAAGEMVARELFNVKERIYQPVGFVDDDPTKIYSRIHGIRVLGTTNDIKTLIKMHDVEEVIIAIPSASGKTIRSIVSKCEQTDVKFKTVPELHKILTGEIAIKELRDVQAEDLLGRATVQINTKDVSSFIKNKVVLITGAGGTIGSELCAHIAKFEPRMLILYDHGENDTYFLRMEIEERYPGLQHRTVIGDIKDIGLLKHTFSKYRPHVVFHSAAHKHVPLMEENIVAAVKNNIIGTRNFMYAAEHYKAEVFVMISTDKAVNPASVMGASKRIAEMIVQTKAKKARTKFMAVRFGNVIGSSGSVVPIFKRQIKKGGPVTVTHPDVRRFFMSASEAAQLVIQAGAMGKGGEIFILDMGEQIKISDLARNLIILSGLDPDKDIEIKFVGLRPGEKMHEETLLDIENDRATKHDKIYIAQPTDFSPLLLRKNIEDLERFANLMDEEKILKKIKEMIPNYGLNNNGGWRNEKK